MKLLAIVKSGYFRVRKTKVEKGYIALLKLSNTLVANPEVIC